MLAEHNGHVSDSRDVSSNTPDDILLSVQVVLSFCIELGVIRNVVVALGQKLRGSLGEVTAEGWVSALG